MAILVHAVMCGGAGTRLWPWSRGDRTKLYVRAGGKLSLPEDRSEHWVVVRGAARAILGEDVRLLREGESLHVLAGTRRRLENPGDAPLHVIAVRPGGNLADGDITRLDDRCEGSGKSRPSRDKAD